MLEEFDISIDEVPVLEQEFVDDLLSYTSNSTLNKKDYRSKMNELYVNIGDVKPIDNEINDVVYFDSYEENGISLNKDDVSLNQIWTDYRLIYNEKNNSLEKSYVLDNFDELYDSLSKKVDGIDNYIKELNDLKDEFNFNNELKLNLEQEKKLFEDYKREEMEKIHKKELELSDKLNRVNDLIKKLDEKLGRI